MRVRPLLLLALAALNLAAGGKALATTGVLEYQQGQYERAIDTLAEALADRGLKASERHKATLVRAQAFSAIAIDPDLATRYPAALLQAHALLQGIGGERLDPANQHRRDDLVEALGAQLLAAGAEAHNAGDSARALPFVEAATAYGDDASTWATVGVVRTEVGKQSEALQAFLLAIERFEADPASPPPLMPAAYTAAVAILMADDPNGALRVLKSAVARLPEPGEELVRYELALYQRLPELWDEARPRFEAHLAANPGDTDVRLAFGSMLDQHGDHDAARTLFEEVLARDPKNATANANLAAHWVNRAVAVQGKMAEAGPDEEAKLEAERVELMRHAYPYLVAAHEADPSEPAWLGRLVTAAGLLPDRQADLARWSKLLEALR